MLLWQIVVKQQALNCVGCQNKHPLEKCESIIEKEAFELEDQSIKESKTVI